MTQSERTFALLLVPAQAARPKYHSNWSREAASAESIWTEIRRWYRKGQSLPLIKAVARGHHRREQLLLGQVKSSW